MKPRSCFAAGVLRQPRGDPFSDSGAGYENLLPWRGALVLVRCALSWWLCLILAGVTCDLGWQDLKLMSAGWRDCSGLGLTRAGYLLEAVRLLP